MSSVWSPRSGTQFARLTFKILPTASYLLAIQDNFWFMWGLAQPWARPSVIASERWTQNVVRAKQKILSIHLHSSLQKQAPHYWPLVFISPEDINFAASTTIHKRGILRLLHSCILFWGHGGVTPGSSERYFHFRWWFIIGKSCQRLIN